MKDFTYYAIISPDDETLGFSVSFPDLENVFTDGHTVVDALIHAEEVLESMLEVMIDYEEDFNQPSPVSAFKLKEGESLVAVHAQVTPKGKEHDFSEELSKEEAI